ncbi:hypothetical protein [Acaryochloris sp. CCMEE 5410]|uniref:hypothetical protein n=1 Tax=Acaryochloris sp. CCMEE 5410 TaxID=310037 RepID=UPI000584B05C|nr:hypothetical protein [Acaryochloris sp. CCMEE 5410]KAI9129427.1 hypothetical protein ON05_035540 [Acaryochloris sp. CCMEE 5410]
MNTSREMTHNDEVLALRQQLVSSLKFHHCETLQKIPLESAVRAMTAAWDTCHPQDLPPYCSGTSTAIVTREQAAKSIRESKYFSGS